MRKFIAVFLFLGALSVGVRAHASGSLSALSLLILRLQKALFP